MSKKESKKESQNEPKMDKKVVYALVGVAAVSLLLVALFFLTPSTPDEDPRAQLLYNSYNKMIELDSYEIIYQQEEGILSNAVKLSKSDNMRYAEVENDIEKKTFLFRDNKVYFCQVLDGKEMCAEATNSSILANTIDQAKTQFIEPSTVSIDKNVNQYLAEKGALEFIGEIEQNEYNSIPCREIKYTIDYSGLKLVELNEIGLSPSNPIVSMYRNFTNTRCIHEETGIPVYTELTYSSSQRDYNFTRTVESLSKEPAASFEIPEILHNISEVEDFALEVTELKEKYGSCESIPESSRGTCYSSLAFNEKDPRFCERIKDNLKHDRCLISLLTTTRDPTLCEMAVEYTDDCYAEAARRLVDVSICDEIENVSLRNICIGNVSQMEPPKNETECVTDAGCKVGGEIGEMCVPVGWEVPSPGDELHPCYDTSFDYNNCICIKGKCDWEQTPEHSACVVQMDIENRDSMLGINSSESANHSGSE